MIFGWGVLSVNVRMYVAVYVFVLQASALCWIACRHLQRECCVRGGRGVEGGGYAAVNSAEQVQGSGQERSIVNSDCVTHGHA